MHSLCALASPLLTHTPHVYALCSLRSLIWALWALCVLCVLCVLPSEIYAAGGVFNAPHGAEATGSAGAVVAGRGTLHGAWYNPALIAGVAETSALLDLTLTAPDFTYTRASSYDERGELVSFAPVSNSAPPTLAPQLGLAHSFGLKQWRFALNGFAPNGVASQYPLNGPQRYQMIDSTGSLVWMTSLAVAYAPTPSLWLGVALVNTSAKIRQALMASGYPGFLGAPEDPAFDVLVDTEDSSALNLSAQLGARLTLKRLSLGASVWLPTHIELNNLRLRQRLPSHPLFDGATVEGERAEMSVDLPLIARFGVRYEREERWSLELDAVYEDHSALQALESEPQGIYVRDVGGGVDFKVGTTSIPRLFKATWSLRLGGSWQASQRLITRLGVAWEQGAAPLEATTIAALDSEKLILCAGASWRLSSERSLWLDAGYAFTAMSDRAVSSSVIKQVNPLNPEGALPIGGGLYQGSLHMLSLGVRWGAYSPPHPSPNTHNPNTHHKGKLEHGTPPSPPAQ